MAASPCPLPVLLPDSARLSVESVRDTDGAVLIVASATGETAACPICGFCSRHIHSRYGRTLLDLPWQGSSVRIELRTRRFYCQSKDCRRKIFTERFPSLTVAYGRQTNRHSEVLNRVGYALGGEAGFRLASCFGLESSPDTILRILKRGAGPLVGPEVKVLGVDDWAWKKSRNYGTILVDLERHRPVDLLPDRESETLEKWLRAHPGVEVISRDRAGAYAEGARNGAPEALQVADRFHILCNLTQSLQRLLERFAGTLRRSQALEVVASQNSGPNAVPAEPKEPTNKVPSSDPMKLNRHQQQSQQRRERRKARFEAVRAAHQRGLTLRAIHQEFGLAIKTIRRFLQATEFPEQPPRRRHTGLEPYREYLEKRWAEGCRNAARLWRELKQRGYAGQRSRVGEFLHSWRSLGPQAPNVTKANRKLPGLRSVALWLAKPPEKRKPLEEQWVQAISKDHPEIAAAEQLAQAFRHMVKNSKVGDLDTWLERVDASSIPELNSFATGIRRDYAAVSAGIEKTWSNGQVEGQVHRLKLLKRQMYGRSGFLLLRRRVLPFQLIVEPHASRSP